MVSTSTGKNGPPAELFPTAAFLRPSVRKVEGIRARFSRSSREEENVPMRGKYRLYREEVCHEIG
jgi:hypothetical protein